MGCPSESELCSYLNIALASGGKDIHPEMKTSVGPRYPFQKKDKFHLDLPGGSAQNNVDLVLSLFSIPKRKRHLRNKAIGTRVDVYPVMGSVSLVVDDSNNQRAGLPDH